VQRQHCQLLLVAAVAGDLAALAEQDEVVGTVPVLDDVQTLVDFASEGGRAQVATEKDRPARLAELGQCLVGGMLQVVAGEAPQDRLGLGRAFAQGCGQLDQLVVLLADQLPSDRLRQNGCSLFGAKQIYYQPFVFKQLFVLTGAFS